jgi:hypothetical protein
MEAAKAPATASETVAFTFTSIERTEEIKRMMTRGLHVPVCNEGGDDDER